MFLLIFKMNKQNKLNININNRKMTNELKEWFNNKVEEIVTAVKGDVKVSNDVAEQTAITVNLGDNEEIKNKISEFETNNTELSNKISLLEEELATAKGTNETLTNEIEALNAKINIVLLSLRISSASLATEYTYPENSGSADSVSLDIFLRSSISS